MRQHEIEADGRVSCSVLRAETFELEISVPEEPGAFSAKPPVALVGSVFLKAGVAQEKIKCRDLPAETPVGLLRSAGRDVDVSHKGQVEVPPNGKVGLPVFGADAVKCGIAVPEQPAAFAAEAPVRLTVVRACLRGWNDEVQPDGNMDALVLVAETLDVRVAVPKKTAAFSAEAPITGWLERKNEVPSQREMAAMENHVLVVDPGDHVRIDRYAAPPCWGDVAEEDVGSAIVLGVGAQIGSGGSPLSGIDQQRPAFRVHKQGPRVDGDPRWHPSSHTACGNVACSTG